MSYNWDTRGNLLSDGTFTCKYNAARRMVRAQSVTATLVHTYNADGLRVAQSVDGDVTTSVWDWASALRPSSGQALPEKGAFSYRVDSFVLLDNKSG